MDESDLSNRPDTEYNLPDNLLFRNTSNGCIPGIYGHLSVIAHHENPGIRHLIGKFYITLSKGFALFQVRFIDLLIVHIDIT